jgi:hypothetical protein
MELTCTSVSEFQRYLDANKSINGRSLTRSGDWTGVNSWDDFETYLQEGNPKLIADLNTHTQYYINMFEDKFVDIKEYVRDVVGDFFDVGAVVLGEPEAWLKEIHVKDEKFIDIIIQGTYKDGTDIEMVEKNGAKVFAIVSILEQRGFLVNMKMVFSSNDSNTKNSREVSTLTIVIKDYQEILDYKKMAILLGVPFFRRGFLRVLEVWYGKNVKGNYGSVNTKIQGAVYLDDTRAVEALEQKLMMEN